MSSDTLRQAIYFYDLPKDTITSSALSNTIKEITGIQIDAKPQINRNPNRPFYSAVVRVEDKQKYDKICAEMKYFKFNNNECRALPFDQQVLGSNRLLFNKLHTVFVAYNNKDRKLYSRELEEEFSQYGEVTSSKAAIDQDYKLQGYGFVTFKDPASVARAVQATLGKDFIAVAYQQKERSLMKSKITNNIYAKNFPIQWGEQEIRDIFEKHGNIKSLFIKKQKIPGTENEAQFAFICYEHPNGTQADREYGQRCAQEAIDQLNGKIISGQELYVREALTKKERDEEKKKEQVKFKNSKRRCNLYVKNFPPGTKTEELRELFTQFGPIESIKIFPKEEEGLYAFVCYQNPESASSAKTYLNNYAFNGKQLYINLYEMKEQRQLQQEEMRDKVDWQNYTKQQPSNINLDLFNRPDMMTLIQALVQQLQRNFQPRNNQMRGQYGNNRQGAPGRQYGQQNQFGQQQQQPGLPQRPAQPQPSQMPLPQQQRQPYNLQQIPQQYAQQPPFQAMTQVPIQGIIPQATPGQQPTPQQLYANEGRRLLPGVAPNNPNYKGQVGEFIYEYVEQIAGEEKAPKITGMLIDLPMGDIHAYLVDYGRLQFKVQEANQLLSQQQ